MIDSRSPGISLVTLIGRAVVDKKLTPFGLSILRRLSLPIPVSPDPDSYSLSESLLESYERFLHFLLLVAFFAFLNGFKHCCHLRQPFLAPMLFVGLMLVGRLTSSWTEGLAILVITATLTCIVGQVGAAMSLAQLTKLLDAGLLRD